MLGMVFTEFIEMVENKFSPDMADSIIQEVAPGNDGAYTAVGYYDHAELVAMVISLSKRSNIAVPELVRAFGHHLLSRFTALYPSMFARHQDLFDFVASIDGHIHVEVHKLYDQAKLPRFTVLEHTADSMDLLYQSPRSMEALALGLLEGAIEHYKRPCSVTQRAWEDGKGNAGTVFEIKHQPA